jgi:MFS family permease
MENNEPAPEARANVAARLLRSGTFASLSLGQFRLLLAGTAASQVGAWMELVARGWLILQLTGSPFQLGLIGFINGGSSLLASPLAGFLTDQLDRRVLAAATQLLAALIALVIGLLVLLDEIALWHLYITAVVHGVTTAVNMPARQVLVYDVVGGDKIVNAIALNSVTANVARIGAPSVGGALIAGFGIEEAYYAQAVFFLLATVATLLLRPVTVAAPVRVPVLRGLREGLEYVRSDPVMSRLVLLNAVPTILIYPYVTLFPIFADDVLDVGSTGYGVLLSAVGFGSIPGGLLVAGMSNAPYKGRVMGGAALLYMGMVAAFAASRWFGLSFGLLVVGGVGWSVMVILNQTLLQLRLADDALRGRMVAFLGMSNGLTPLGNLGMGAAADRFGVQTAVISFALAGFVLAGYLGLGSSRMRNL